MNKTDKYNMFACLWLLLANTAPNDGAKYFALIVAIGLLVLAIFRKEQNQ